MTCISPKSPTGFLGEFLQKHLNLKKGKMSVHFKKIFEPIQIGSVQIKNRIAMAPMGTLGLLNPDGSPGPRAVDYYIERALGGVGLIIKSCIPWAQKFLFN